MAQRPTVPRDGLLASRYLTFDLLRSLIEKSKFVFEPVMRRWEESLVALWFCEDLDVVEKMCPTFLSSFFFFVPSLSLWLHTGHEKPFASPESCV